MPFGSGALPHGLLFLNSLIVPRIFPHKSRREYLLYYNHKWSQWKLFHWIYLLLDTRHDSSQASNETARLTKTTAALRVKWKTPALNYQLFLSSLSFSVA